MFALAMCAARLSKRTKMINVMKIQEKIRVKNTISGIAFGLKYLIIRATW
jgi:hypothetical protein